MRPSIFKTVGKYAAEGVAYQMGLKGYSVGSCGSDAYGCYRLGFFIRAHYGPPQGRQLAEQNAAMAESMIACIDDR